MSWMSEKKARELLKLYMEAELAGKDDNAAAIEKQLKDAGWKITTAAEGVTVQKSQKDMGAIGDFFLPQESTITPYGDPNTTKNSNKTLLITIGIAVGLIGTIALIVYLVKKSKNAAV